MRTGELAANLAFWTAAPAGVWWLAARCGWGWLAAGLGGLGLGILAALIVALLGSLGRDN